MAPPNSTHIPGCTVRVATFAFETLGPRHIRVCRYQKFEIQFLTFAASQTGRSVVMVGTALPTHNSHLFPANAMLTQVDQLFDTHRLRQSGGMFEYCGDHLELGQVWLCVMRVDYFNCVCVCVCCDIYVDMCIYVGMYMCMYIHIHLYIPVCDTTYMYHHLQVLDALNHTGEFSIEEMSFVQRCTKLTGLPSLYRCV